MGGATKNVHATKRIVITVCFRKNYSWPLLTPNNKNSLTSWFYISKHHLLINCWLNCLFYLFKKDMK